MTKVQMKNEALSLIAKHKASAKLTAALTELFEEFVQTANRDTVKREQDIVVDGNEYRWCNRHEVYEPITNFKDTKKTTVACKLAAHHWFQLGKEIKTLNDSLMAKAMEGEDVQEEAVKLKELKEIRGGRYSFEANALQYPDMEDYIYDESKFIKEEDS